MNQAEFDDAMRAGELRIALVGMSNVGKTKAGRALQKTGNFEHFEIDADIRRSLGLTSMDELADWLGLPGSLGYLEREKKYLELEKMYTISEYFAPREGEDTHDALIRSYPDLLRERLQRFRSLSHVNIPVAPLDLGDGRTILNSIRTHLV